MPTILSSIFEDRAGYLWFCSNEGLYRYDGTNIKVYKSDLQDLNSLSSSSINYMAEDPGGTFWISTYGCGLNAFDPLAERYMHYFHDEHDPASISDNNPRFLEFDREGLLWIGFDGEEGLDQFDPVTGKAKRFRVKRGQPGQLQGRVLGNIIADSNRIYLATTAGFEYFDKASGQFHFVPLLDEKRDTICYSLNAICKSRDGTIWMDMPGEGLRMYDPRSGHATVLDIKTEEGLANPKPSHILEGKDGRLWLVNFDELWSLSPGRLQLQQHQLRFYEEEPIRKFTGLRSAFIDRYGMLWIDNNYFDPRRTLFDFHEIHSPKNNAPLQTGTIWELNDSVLALSTPEGFYWYNLKSQTPSPATFGAPVPIGESTFSPDKSGWIFLRLNNTLAIYDSRPKKTYHFPLEKNGKPFPISPFVPMGIAFDKKEDLWINTWGQGLIRIKSGVWKKAKGPIRDFDQWLPKDPKRPLPTENLLGILVDSCDNIWVGCSIGGLVRIDGQDESIRCFDVKQGANSISSTRIFMLAEDASGNIWMGATTSGINKYDVKTGLFTVYDQRKGSFNDNVGRLFIDKEGLIWASNEYGLTCFDPVAETFTQYDEKDGLVAWELNGFVSKKTNRLFWGGVRGFHVADLDRLKNRPTQASDIVLTAVEAFDPESKRLQPVRPNEWADRALSFSHRQNIIHIRFAVLDFRNSSKHRYQYAFTQGGALDWIDLHSENQVTFSQLPPGIYFFHLRGCNSDQIWTELATPLKIVIYPPFWETTWAYILYGLLLGGAVYYLYRLTLTRQLAKNEARQVKALEQLRARFYTNITHEFRTPLTVILGLTEEPADVSSALKLIRRNGKRLLQLINQLLDLSKLDNNSLQPRYQQIEIVSITRYIGESFQSLSEKKHLHLEVSSGIGQLWMDMDEELYRQIVSNLLSNAIKFTPTNGRICLNLEEKGNLMILEVQDNGIGIPIEGQPYIFDRFYQVDHSETDSTKSERAAIQAGEGTGIGLALVKEMTALLGGRIEVESEMGRGTIFTVELPIRRQADKKTEAFEPVRIGQEIEEPLAVEPAAGDAELPGLLLIEDNHDVVFYIQSLLQSKYNIQIANNGAIGIEKAIETIPDIIISDVMMPEKNGLEVVETLKQDRRTSHIPIILLTARATREDRIEGLRYGADAYLMKPFDKAELFVRLEKLVELRKALQARYAQAVEPKLTFVFPQSGGQAAAPSLDDRFLENIRRIIDEKISDADLDIPYLCKKTGLSSTQLHRKMKALTGEAPISFIRKVRLHKAKELLQTTDLTISEIAYNLGFNDPNYFSRAFGKEFGCSPGEIRN
ncbi:MAG: helix-turn-helix domain-containing protein [Lewinellaceae bacterium]|nr:helix-turn-helix domain-containing protein [Lewinellaceae bacterium]